MTKDIDIKDLIKSFFELSSAERSAYFMTALLLEKDLTNEQLNKILGISEGEIAPE